MSLQWPVHPSYNLKFRGVAIQDVRDSIEKFHEWWPRPKPEKITVDILNLHPDPCHVACIHLNGVLGFNIKGVYDEIQTPDFLPYLPMEMKPNQIDMFTILAHEFIHLEQVATGKIVFNNRREVFWEGHLFNICNTYRCYRPNVHRVPWEIDAYKFMGPLSDKFRNETGHQCPLKSQEVAK